MTNKGEIDLIISLLNRWNGEVQLNNAIGHYDINKLAEGLSAELLNIIYDLKLFNLNTESENHPSIDLGDKENKVAYQVTSRTDADKVRSDVRNFVDKKYNETYTNGIFFFIITQSNEKIKFGKTKLSEIYPPFNEEENIITLRDIMKKIKDFYASNNEKFKAIKSVLSREFGTDIERNIKELPPTLTFSFQNEFHLHENEEELSIFLQNISRRHKQNELPCFEIIIAEEAMLNTKIKDLEKDSQNTANKKQVARFKDILFGISKIKNELIFKIEALILTKSCMGYSYAEFDMFAKSFLELTKDLWQAQLIMEETYAMEELQTRYTKIKTERIKGRIKLWIDCGNNFGFSIWEEPTNVEKIFRSYQKDFQLSNKSDVRMAFMLRAEVFDLDFDTIIYKVIPGFIDELYHQEKTLDSIKDIRLQDKVLSMG